ncbi:ral guanine nucleotide dissociation stimulator-like isoform X1 [Dasypus novemcinctus]|uniref:ral guanine nucleotide dissociation stimulator-like isoform X1 n=1 Tax=Dasypus novemcinctus TaxID=9361 RepID=UPI0039C9F885
MDQHYPLWRKSLPFNIRSTSSLLLEEALVPPPQPPMGVGPMTTLQIEPTSSPDGAPAARLEEGTSPSASQVPELEAIPPLSPVPPIQSAPGSLLELQPGYSPSSAQALEGKACLAAPPEPLSELKSAAGLVTSPEPSCSWPETSKNLLNEEKANLLAFPPELVEQLTRMDVEYQKIAELQQLQAGCFYDSLMPNEQFGTSFGDMEHLSKKDR